MYGDVGEIKIYQFPKVPKNAISKLQLDGALVLSYQKPRKAGTEYIRPAGSGGSNENLFALELMKQMQDENRQLRDENRLIVQKLDAILLQQQAIDDSDDDDEISDQSQNNFLGALMGNPMVQNFITNLLTNAMGGNRKPTAMAGTEPAGTDPQSEQMELTQLINNLLSKGVTLDHLRKLGAMPDEKIKMLLSML